MRTSSAISLLLLCALAGCESATEPAKITLDAGPSVIRASMFSAKHSMSEAQIEWVSFSIDLTLVNMGSSSIYFQPCGRSVERMERPGRWVMIWSGFCLSTPPIEVQPNSRYEDVLGVIGALSGPGAPPFGGRRVPGLYRVVVHVSTEPLELGRAGPASRYLYSPTFAVVE